MTANAPQSDAPIKVSTPADILSYVPHILGFQPRESLVFLTMSGKRVGATLRLDLPPAESDPLEYAETVRDYLESDTSADGVLMVVYTDSEWEEPGAPPHAPLIHCLDLVLDAAGLTLLDGWLVSSRHWRDYFCEDASCCPWPGHPLARITESILNAELVYQGSTYAESLEAAVGTGDIDRNDEIHKLTDAYIAEWTGRWDRTSLGRDSLILWDALISNPLDRTESRRSPELIAFLLAGLTSAPVRDSVIVLAAVGAGAAQDAAEAASVLPVEPEEVDLPHPCVALKESSQSVQQVDGSAHLNAGPSAAGSPAVLFREVFLATLSAPDWERLDAAHALFLNLTAVASGQPRSALFSILGWLEWARGRGSRAHSYLQEALAETPDYTLAELLLTLVGTGSLAPWARKRETAWTSDSRRAA
ncbi:DUF4192 domain-containing protein [uncultured Arthrobacter sp.]|uniref:DUF4192 domain-containing protein n=1 Tax=uncultured Arthrobacter sp. TaxID=114050 RepID=UPI00261A499E|nr:DUF4192 domain-containing protein [uncultured Arthrobacter sp.]